MVIEEKLPERFRNASYHPSLFIYAWKRDVLDKLLEEIMQCNIAVLGGEAWLVQGNQTFGVIPLRKGTKEVLSWKIKRQKGEEWYDFVERSVKETTEVISFKDLEKKVTNQVKQKIYYHFELGEENK